MNQLQDLLTEGLIRTKHVENAAAINIQEKKVCASTSGFHVPPENALNLIYSFYKNLLEVRRGGLYFKEKYYKCDRADENSIYLHNAEGGLIVVKTKTLILVATYRVGMYPSVCVEAVEKLGTGVDIILDCVGSSYWEKNLKCLSTGGRWIIYGLLSGGEVHGDLLGRLLSKRGSIHTSLLRPRDREYKEQLVKAFTEDVLPYFSGGASPHLQPVVDSIYPLHQIAEAHKFMEENKNIGKIVIEMPTSS